MDGPAAWMMTARWDGAYAALMFGMWSVMMLGMMLPSAAAGILLYARVARSDARSGSPVTRTYLFAAGYLLAWAAFSAVATLLQWLLASATLLTPMMESDSHRFSAAVLIAAGIYQWTPLKDVCLRQCRGPADFLARYWRRGMTGALRMGFQHGLYCVGCCWVLMLLLFVGGVMNLVWIAAITVFVLVEKLAPPGVLAGRVVGLLMMAAGLLLLVR
jgi:predicted metal-binding membrane protein